MKTNWLWDSSIEESEAVQILKQENHPQFNLCAEKLFSRVNDPETAFRIIDKVTFCKKWPGIKKRMNRDSRLKNRTVFWQTIYENIHENLKKQGIKIRSRRETEIPAERMELAREIKKIRLESGCTQKDMAKKLGVIQQYISKIENGHENFSIDTLKKIAGALNKKLMITLR